MRRPWILISLTAITLVPFVINAIGQAVFLYITIGSRDCIFAASQGVSHNAVAEHLPANPVYDSFSTTLIHVGPIHVFTERPGEFRPYRFGVMTSPDYLGFEFPWLLIPTFFCLLALWRWQLASTS
jgi:hypothetical protein